MPHLRHDARRFLATVLFTDIVGSTERAARLGDRPWRDLLERHNAVVRRELRAFQGREVDTAGDGFFAVFETPERAVRCAAAISTAVVPLDLQVRPGAVVVAVAGGPRCRPWPRSPRSGWVWRRVRRRRCWAWTGGRTVLGRPGTAARA